MGQSKKTEKSFGLGRSNSFASVLDTTAGGLEVDSRKARSSASSIERFFFRDEERRRWEDVLIGLSRHPVLENFGSRMGIWQLDRIDYYSMHQTHWSKTFKRTSVLGIPGTKARIMMLFIWSLTSGHSTEQVSSFVSEVVNQGMFNYLTNASMEDIALLLAGPYKGIIEDLVKEFKCDFPPEVADRLNKALPSDWNHRGPQEYEYEAPGLENIDVTDVTSLRPLLVVPDQESIRLFKPANKESERTLWWFVKMFHLGCLAESKDKAAKGFYFAVRMPGMTK